MFSHLVVYYTDPNQPKAADELVAAINQYLKPIPGVQFFHVGKMVPSGRAVVEKGYQVALNTAFANRKAMDDYQTHPLFREFVEKAFRRLCKKVTVYDFE
jgi:hypothetical protein